MRLVIDLVFKVTNKNGCGSSREKECNGCGGMVLAFEKNWIRMVTDYDLKRMLLAGKCKKGGLEWD